MVMEMNGVVRDHFHLYARMFVVQRLVNSEQPSIESRRHYQLDE